MILLTLDVCDCIFSPLNVSLRRELHNLLENIAKVILIQVQVHFLQKPPGNLDCSVSNVKLTMRISENEEMGLSFAGLGLRRLGSVHSIC